MSFRISAQNKLDKTVTDSFHSVFIRHFSVISVSSILFNSLLRLLLTDRNSQTSVLFLVTDVDQLFFITLGNILFRCFVSSMLASLKSLSMPADHTGTLKVISAHTLSLASLLNFQKRWGPSLVPGYPGTP